jgi:hypothetical protein
MLPKTAFTLTFTMVVFGALAPIVRADCADDCDCPDGQFCDDIDDGDDTGPASPPVCVSSSHPPCPPCVSRQNNCTDEERAKRQQENNPAENDSKGDDSSADDSAQDDSSQNTSADDGSKDDDSSADDSPEGDDSSTDDSSQDDDSSQN